MHHLDSPAFRCAVALCLLAAASVAHAQDTVADIRITFDLPAPQGSIVEAEAVDVLAPPRSVRADGTRLAVIRSIPSGSYTVRVRIGAAAPAETRLRVNGGERVWFLVGISTADGVPTIRLFDRRFAGQATTFSAQDLSELPSGRDLWPLLETAVPFMVADRMDTGGLSTGTVARVGSQGASWTVARLALGDEVPQSSVAGGSLSFLPDLHVADSVTVLSTLLPPEHGSPGPIITVAPKRPGRSRRGALDLSFSPESFVATNDSDEIPSVGRLRRWISGSIEFGGPLPGGLGALVSARVTDVKMTTRGRSSPDRARAASLFAIGTAARHDDDRFTLALSGSRLRHPYDNWKQLGSRAVDQVDDAARAQFTWQHSRGDGGTATVSAGYTRGTFSPRPDAASPGGVVDRAFDGPMPPPATASTADRINARSDWAWPVRRLAGMSHELRVGATLSRSTLSSSVIVAPSVAELADGLPARIWITSAAPRSSIRRTDGAVALSDRLTLASRLTMDVGLRLDVSTGGAEGAAGGVTWTSALPRVSFVWAPGLFTVSGGYARYRPEISFDALAFGDPGQPLREVYRWNDVDQDRALDADEHGFLVSAAGRSAAIASIDPDLEGPRTDEVSLTFEQRFSSRSSVRATAVVRRERSLVGSVNVGVPLSSYRSLFVSDASTRHDAPAGVIEVFDRLPASFGKDQYRLSNVDGESSYEGMEISFTLRSARWYAMAGVAAYRVEGSGGNRGFRVDENDPGVIGERFETPNAATRSFGRTFFDRAYTGNWSMAVLAPWRTLASFTVRYLDGQPFSRLIVVPNLAQGPEVISADAPGTTRFTFAITLDSRIEKRVSFGSKTLAVTLDAFNLTNHANEIDENPVAGLRFRRSTTVQPPRAFRFGTRLEF